MTEQPGTTQAAFEHNHGATQHTVSPIASVRDSQGILGTATTDQGSLVTRDLQPTDRVRIGGGDGMEVTVEQAVSYGHLMKNADGTYSDVQASSDMTEDASQQEPTNSEPEDGILITDETADTLADWSATLHEFTGSKSAMVGLIGDIIANGPDHTPNVMKSLSIEYGQDLGKVQNTIRTMYDDVSRGLVEVVEAEGVNVEDFFNYTKASDPAAYRSAIVEAAITQSTGALKTLINRFKSTPQGYEAYSQDAGQVVTVKVGGSPIEMDKAQAKRLGFI